MYHEAKHFRIPFSNATILKNTDKERFCIIKQGSVLSQLKFIFSLKLDCGDAEHRNKFFNKFQGTRIIYQYYRDSYISTLLSVTEGAAVFKMEQGSSSFIAKVMQKQKGRSATVEYEYQQRAYRMKPDFIAEPLEHIPSDKILNSDGFSIFKMESLT